MSVGRFLLPLCAVLLFGAVSAPPLAAQSLFSARGLGYVMEPLDARGRGLGGVGLGLPEPSLSLINPAGVAGLPAPTLHVTVQPDQFTSTFGGAEVTAGTVRFPVIHAALPFRRWTATLGFASFLDRNWAVERDTVLAIGGADLGVRDRFASHGGVSRLRLGTAYAVAPRVAVGAAVDIYSGTVRDTTYRLFEDGTLNPAINASSLTFRGVGYAAGARWVPSEAFAVDASVSAGGQLEMRDEAQATTQSHDLPLQLAAGVSGRVTPTTLVALSGRWSGWSSVDEAFVARDTWSMAGGIEWEALRVGGNVVPLRLGGRYALLPFQWAGAAGAADFADERAATLGTGVRLAGGAARLDAAVERGERGGDAAGITESFWRMAFSLTVLSR